jgi:cytoskeletal protein CcmA (bactofilin family)
MSDGRDLRLGQAPSARPGPLDRATSEPAERQRQTLVEEGTSFKGVMTSTCPVVVRGAVEGEIAGPSLHVSASGTVAGRVNVASLHSEGVLSGEFDAETVQLSGQVKDNTVIRARSIEVKLSPEKGKMQLVFGECDLEVGDVPAKEDAVAEALEAREPGQGRPARGNGARQGGAEAAEDKPAKKGKGEEARGASGDFPTVPNA